LSHHRTVRFLARKAARDFFAGNAIEVAYEVIHHPRIRCDDLHSPGAGAMNFEQARACFLNVIARQSDELGLS
jgi:hypothetical protein